MNGETYISIPREDSVIPLLTTYLDLNSEVIEKADNYRYGTGNDIRLVILGLFALFSNFKLSTNSGKHSEHISQAHLVSLAYKFLTSAKDYEDLSNGFDRDRDTRKKMTYLLTKT